MRLAAAAIVGTIVFANVLACDPAKSDGDASKSKAAKAEPAKAEPAKPEPTAETKAPLGAPQPLPADAEVAARQLAAFLEAPGGPTPSLLTAASEVELREFCGACDGKEAKTPRTSKIVGFAALADKARALAESAPAEAVVVEEKIDCKDGCCKFVPDPDVGVGDNVVNVEQICVTLDAGKPTAYTRIDVSGSW